jgi:mannosyltransferase OCH1-like enzyme
MKTFFLKKNNRNIELNRNQFFKRQLLKRIRINNIRELINNKNKPDIIPRNIFQAWHSDTLPNSVKYCIENIKKCNPNFNHYLYNDEKCREFIKEHFSEEVLKAYDSIVPAAIKIDLWRYCILYKYGGIYLDVKYFCVNGFNFNYLLDKEYFCKDVKNSGSGIYNAIIICKPNNEIMKKCIEQVVNNVNNKFYGNSIFEPSGPLMVKKFFTEHQFNNLKLNLCYVNDVNKLNINYNIFSILHFHDNYRNEQPTHNKHWSQYWEERNMYI